MVPEQNNNEVIDDDEYGVIDDEDVGEPVKKPGVSPVNKSSVSEFISFSILIVRDDLLNILINMKLLLLLLGRGWAFRQGDLFKLKSI